MLREFKWLTQDHTASEWGAKSKLHSQNFGGLTASKAPAPTPGDGPLIHSLRCLGHARRFWGPLSVATWVLRLSTQYSCYHRVHGQWI